MRTKRKYVSGEKLFVWGRQYLLQVNYRKKNSLVLSDDTAVFSVRKECTFKQREKFIREWYRKKLAEEIEQLLPKWEKKTGLKAESWQIRYMTSRWGSCKIKKRKICLNLQLAVKPPECLEYIILHELVHFLERGHNERFKNFMTKYMPNWKEIKKTLNSNL